MFKVENFTIEIAEIFSRLVYGLDKVKESLVLIWKGFLYLVYRFLNKRQSNKNLALIFIFNFNRDMNHFLIIGIALAILIFIALLGIFLFAWSAKKTLLRGETAWSAKNIPIRRSDFDSNMKRSDQRIPSSMLESISDQTREYLTSEEELNENM